MAKTKSESAWIFLAAILTISVMAGTGAFGVEDSALEKDTTVDPGQKERRAIKAVEKREKVKETARKIVEEGKRTVEEAPAKAVKGAKKAVEQAKRGVIKTGQKAKQGGQDILKKVSEKVTGKDKKKLDGVKPKASTGSNPAPESERKNHPKGSSP